MSHGVSWYFPEYINYVYYYSHTWTPWVCHIRAILSRGVGGGSLATSIHLLTYCGYALFFFANLEVIHTVWGRP